jgi:hypothetical protein
MKQMSANPIVVENQKPGTPDSVWNAPTSPDEIEGFATDISVNHGDTVSFKINVNPVLGANVPYHIEIYRLGYYGGDGATLVTTINGLHGTNQPNPITDPITGEVDAGNWSVSASWTTPATAVSGVYIARLVLDGGGSAGGDSNQIPFIVRDDGGTSDVVFQTSDPTWQAYNGWGGNNGQVGANFYGGNVTHPPPEDPGLGSQSRTFAVSYNRPLITNGPSAGTQDSLMGAEYAGIYWLEENGYDVSYIAGVDTDRLGVNALLGHKVYLSVGHDEYWSGNQRANVTAARDAGVNLAFLSGNEVYWKTRYAASTVSTDGSPTAYRTLISYKETWDYNDPTAPPSAYTNNDPSDQWTGTWIDGRFSTSTDASGKLDAIGGGNPPNSLTGQLFAADGTGAVGPGITVTAPESQLAFWKNTSVAADGGVTDLAPGILGYEFDASPYTATTPSDLIHLSDTTVDWGAVLSDQGNHEPAGPVTHQLSLYKAPSGALVFGAGTVFWTWGLSDQHDDEPYGATIANSTIQQVTVNLLAQMGVQPATLQTNLVLASISTDTIAPHATIMVNGAPASVDVGQSVTISGTAIDDNNSTNPANYGKVAAVEVSTDDGATWNVADQTPSQTTTGAVNWTYTYTASEAGADTLLVRPIDDSLNMQTDITKLASTTLNVIAPPGTGYGLFNSTDGPAAGVNATVNDDNGTGGNTLGVRFESDVAGTITQIKYYRSAADTDFTTRQGELWSPTGALLGTAIFTASPGAEGWQTATLSTPVVIQADTVYTASYHTLGDYISSNNYFLNTYTSPSGYLTAPVGGNGVYQYGSTPTDPTQSYQGSNYWVDVNFVPSNSSTSPLQITSAANYTVSDDQTAVTAVAATDTPAQTLTYSIVPVANGGSADAAQFKIDPATGVLTFVNAPEFESPADAGHHNVYDVTVAVEDQLGNLQQQNLAVTVTPTAETPTAAAPPVFDGQPVQAEYIFGQTPTSEYPSAGALQTGTVGPGVEFANLPDAGPDVGNGVDGLASVDISSSTVLVDFPLDPNVFPTSLNFASASADPYNGVLITFPNGLPANFAGFTIVNQAGFGTPLTASNITVSGNSVFVSVAGNSRLTDSDPNTPGVQPTYVLLQANYTGAGQPVMITSDGGGATATVTMTDKTSLVTAVQASETGFAGAFTYAIVPASGGGGADSGLFEIINGDELRFTSEPNALAPPPSASGTPNQYQVTVEASDGRGGFVQQTLSVTLVAAMHHPDSSMSSLGASPTTLTADGAQTTTLMVMLEDASGNPVVGQEVQLSADGLNNTFGTIIGVTDTTGTFTTTLASTTAQTETITATENTAQEQTTVVFAAGAPSANNSSLATSMATVTADGVSTTTLTITVRDAHGNPISGQSVSLAGDASNNTFGQTTGTTDANGIFQTTLASTLARTETITATEGSLQEQTSVTFIGGPPSSSTSTLTASAGPVTADGVQTFALTVTLEDADGNPAANQTVTLSGDGSNNGFGADNLATITGMTDANGVFTTTVDSTLARMETITATEAGASESTSVTFAAGAPSAVTSSLVGAPGAVDANGKYTTTLTLAVKDANDNPVAGQSVTLAGGGANFGSATGLTDANGLFTTTVSATLATTPSITATIDGTVQEALSLASTGAPSATTSLLTESVASVPADGASTVTLTVTALDAQGDTVAGKAVTLSGDGSDNFFGAASGVTNAQGVFITTLASDQVQDETITATIGGTAQETVLVSFTTPGGGPAVTTPVITGVVQEGRTLTAAATSGQGDTVTYQWQRSTDGANWTPISGATSATYAVAEGDEGALIEVVAKATDGHGGTASATSLATTPVTDAAPTVTTPTIAGTAQEGQVLTATGATAGQPDNPVSYQWQSSTDGGTTWQPIAGATGSTYTVLPGDENALIEVVATATNEQGASVSATSAATSPVNGAGPPVTTPVITGVVQEGQTLTASATSGQGDTVTYQWQRSADGANWTPISGATGATYVVAEGDEGALIEVVAKATDGQGGTTQATSAPTSVVTDAAPTITPVSISGVAQEGQVLTATGATAGQADNGVTYQWQSSTDGGTTWTAIGGATNSTYTVREGDEGALIEVVATATNGNGTTVSASSSPTAAVTDAAPTITPASIAGVAQEGQVLTATGATAGQSDNPVSYQWQSSSNGGTTWNNIAGATAGAFTVGEAQEGAVIRVVATSTNDNGVTTSTTSSATSAVLDATPSFTAAIVGTAQEGATLTAQLTGVQSDNPVTYQWRLNGSNISGATGSTFVVQEADEGGAITVVVKVTNDNGVTTSLTSSPTSAVTDAAPTVTTPLITGVAQEGQTLTASGAVAGQPDNPVTYQWQLNGTNISGAIGSTFRVQEADEGGTITVVATATNAQGLKASAVSAPTATVIDAAPTVTKPVITGTAQEGQTLRAAATAGQSDNPVTYQWQRSTDGGSTWTAISGATGSTYSLKETDEGALIEVVATATNAQSLTATAVSAPTATVLDAAPTVTKPVITGTAQEGQTLTASASSGQIDNPVSYQWRLNGINIVGATGSTFVVQEADEGGTITVMATATNEQGLTVSVVSAATSIVTDAAPTVTTPTITGTAQEGQTLTATASAGQSDNPVTYQWQLNRTNISGATGSTFRVQEADEGGTITVVATATNAQGLKTSATSAATSTVIDAAPTVTTPVITGVAQEGQTLRAAATAGQSDNPVTYQWQRSTDGGSTWTAISGATGSTYAVKESDEGNLIEVVATATNAQSLTAQATSAATGAVTDAAPTVTKPVITGTAQEGKTLTASASSGQPVDNPVTYQWQLDGGNIAGATGSTFVVQEADEGGTITVVATATNEQGLTASATSKATATVTDAAPTVTTPTITGTAQVGQTLTAAASAGQSDNPVTYQWRLNGFGISGATGSTFVVQAADRGGTISVVAKATNEQGLTVSAVSVPTPTVTAQAPPATLPTTAQEGHIIAAASPANLTTIATVASQVGQPKLMWGTHSSMVSLFGQYMSTVGTSGLAASAGFTTASHASHMETRIAHGLSVISA